MLKGYEDDSFTVGTRTSFSNHQQIKKIREETVASKIMEILSNIPHCNIVITQNPDHAKSSGKIDFDACYQERKIFRIKRNKRVGKHLEINRKEVIMKLYHWKKKTNAATNMCEGLQTCNKL